MICHSCVLFVTRGIDIKFIYKMVFFRPRSHCLGVRPGASRQFAAGGPNRDGIQVRSYIPVSATDQTKFGAQIKVCPGNATACDGAFPV